MLFLLLSACMNGCHSSNEDTACKTWCSDDRDRVESNCASHKDWCYWNTACFESNGAAYCDECETVSRSCKNNKPVTKDECGNRIVGDSCGDDLCVDGECVRCNSSYTYECYNDGNIWKIDLCGEDSLHETCESRSCNAATDTCNPCDYGTREKCINNDLVEADLCDNVISVIDDCVDEGGGCVNGECCSAHYQYSCDYNSTLGRWTVVRVSGCYPDWDIYDICDLPQDGGMCCADRDPVYCCTQ